MNHGSHSHPARLRDRLRDETGRAILAAAEAVFAEDGLHDARMERIASRAGVAVGTLYNHFEDKDALVRSLVRSSRQALLDRVDGAVEPLRRGTVASARFARGTFESAAVVSGSSSSSR